MKAFDSAPILIPAITSSVAGPSPADAPELPGIAVAQQASVPRAREEDPFDRVARLATMILGVPHASVTITRDRLGSRNRSSLRETTGQQTPDERAWCREVIGSQSKLMIDDTRLGRDVSPSQPIETMTVIAWAGFPVRDPDGHVVGALCAADHLPRHWSDDDIDALETLAHIAACEVALQAALQHGAERAELAQTLQESLLPPRLPGIPGLQVAARYVAGGTGAEVLGDFFDVFPSVRGSWGIVVGDVCGKGVSAAKSTALARYTLRAEAHRQTRPSLILAALNQALLDWLTDDPRFLTAIYATVRPTCAGAAVQISSAGHPLALVRRENGRVRSFGRPGTLLGLLADPELHDSRGLLRPGDSLILFTDGVTEARSHIDRDLYGQGRLCGVIADLGEAPAARIADAVQQAAMAFSGGHSSDDTVVLVLKVPLLTDGRAVTRY